MLTLHHLEYSQSFRILWLLEELGADYELKIYERDPKTYQAPAELKKLSPLGSAPVITDDRSRLRKALPSLIIYWISTLTLNYA